MMKTSLVVLCTALILAGCSTINTMATATTGFTSSQQLSNSNTLVPTTEKSIDEPIQGMEESFILSTGSNPDCMLPCWHELRVGEHTSSEVALLFSELLDTSQTYNFANESEEKAELSQGMEDVNVLGESLEFQNSDGDSFTTYALYAVFDANTDELKAILEGSRSFQDVNFPITTEVISTLGPPDWILVGRRNVFLFITLIYKQGIMFSTAIPGSGQEIGSEFCFDESGVQYTVAIMEPIPSINREDLSTVQSEIIPIVSFAPVESLLGLTTEEITQALSEGQTCFELVSETIP